MNYFSYGSNMSIRRLLARVPSAQKIGVGVLAGHELIFHKIGKNDGSAKCDAYETKNPEHQLYGVVFRIAEYEKTGLDEIEGLGYGYEQKDVKILLDSGSTIDAFTYYATDLNAELKPFLISTNLPLCHGVTYYDTAKK